MPVDVDAGLGKHKANSVALTLPIDIRFAYACRRSVSRVPLTTVCMNASQKPKSENGQY